MFEKDRKSNDERWARQAKKHAERGVLERWASRGNTTKDADDFMREEAKRDDEDFEKKFVKESRKEYEIWEEHARPVREAFLQQVRNPEGVDFVTVAVFLPGGMRAGALAGAALGLDLLGANSNIIDYAVGSSSGDNVATRFVGGREQLLRGIAMFKGPLSDEQFIGPRWGNVINLEYLKQLEDEGEYALDEDRIRKAHCKLWTIVTEPMKGDEEPRARILDKKTIRPGISTGSVATMSIPQVTGDIPEIDGEKLYDGGFAAFPLKEVIEKVKSENPGKKVKMLIFTQASFEAMDDIKPAPLEVVGQKVMRSIAGPVSGMGSLKSAATIRQLAKGLVLKENLRKTLKAVEEETGADIGVEWAPPSEVGMVSIDSDEIGMSISQGVRQTIGRFGGTQPEEIPEYIPENKRLLQQAIEEYRRIA